MFQMETSCVYTSVIFDFLSIFSAKRDVGSIIVGAKLMSSGFLGL